jgi:competence protein ComEC
MKRALIVLLLFLVPLAADQALVVSPAAAAQDSAKITVFMTKTGEKYHCGGCRHLSRSKIATTLKDAIERDLGPCSVCKPPTVR